MNQHLPLWYLGQLDSAVCDKAIAEFEALPAQDATMGADGEMVAQDQRSTLIRFAPTGHWFGGLMYQHALDGNAVCNWEYHVTGHENVQYGQYGEGQRYGWHTDTFTLSGRPYDRKVSVICMLSEPEEFEGGTFMMRLYSEYQPELKKGTLMAFPSIIEHQVLPVTKGLRKSAVIWAYGPRFR